ncbi:MAG TPA: 4-hydroxybenzoate 3-monooxygenase [Thermoleophilaceae bacterium]
MRTQVGIVGAGPAGLMLAQLLHLEGLESVIVEARDREYVEKRVRAGLLEQNTVDLMIDAGVGDRLQREGLHHGGIYLRTPAWTHHIDMQALAGRAIWIYGQQEVVKDLINARLESGGDLFFESSDVAVHDIESDRPRVTFTHGGTEHELECDVIAGCDGFHGICRPSVPDRVLTTYERIYDFAWLGILAEAAPSTDELIYAWHPNGFALYSMRSPTVSRLYLQVPADENADDWSDDRIWSELQMRMASEGWQVGEGPIFDKGVTPMRSFVCEPMRHGRLFLTGDAAHIVPPTGAKGLNLAMHDVWVLCDALSGWLKRGDTSGIESYSEVALRRVWRAQDFSNYMTTLLHRFDTGPFDEKVQLGRLEYVRRSEAAAKSLAENYAGLPFGW